MWIYLGYNVIVLITLYLMLLYCNFFEKKYVLYCNWKDITWISRHNRRSCILFLFVWHNRSKARENLVFSIKVIQWVTVTILSSYCRTVAKGVFIDFLKKIKSVRFKEVQDTLIHNCLQKPTSIVLFHHKQTKSKEVISHFVNAYRISFKYVSITNTLNYQEISFVCHYWFPYIVIEIWQLVMI